MPAGDWAQAGRISSQRFNNAMTAVAINSVDPDKLIQESMKARSREKQMAMKAESVLKRTEIEANKHKELTDIDISMQKTNMNLAKTKRKAGLLAAGAAMISGTIMDAKRDKTPPPTFQSDLSGMEALIQKKEGSLQEKMDELREFRDKGPDQVTVPSFNEDGTLNLSGSTLGPQSSTADTTSTTASTLASPGSGVTASSFTPQTLKGLEAIRRVESGPYGYDAYNLGGKTEFDPIGSGTAKDGRFGQPLTQMSIGQIKQLGAAGKIHATGAYQFTHNTGSFGEAARFAGLSDDDIFSPANQDKMAYEFGKKYGPERWSGLKRDPAAMSAATLGFQY